MLVTFHTPSLSRVLHLDVRLAFHLNSQLSFPRGAHPIRGLDPADKIAIARSIGLEHGRLPFADVLHGLSESANCNQNYISKKTNIKANVDCLRAIL